MPNTRVDLTRHDADLIRKWASLWVDLLHVRQALYMREQLANTPANLITRRALWESAIVSYGRMGASDERKVEWETFVRTIGGDGAFALHQDLMRWRHEHVAHRTGAQFETVTVSAIFGETRELNLICGHVATNVGPSSAEYVQRFHDHVDSLMNYIWTKKMAVASTRLLERARKLDPAAGQDAALETLEDQLGVTLNLWGRDNGNGPAAQPSRSA